jgi:hypothetical protein
MQRFVQKNRAKELSLFSRSSLGNQSVFMGNKQQSPRDNPWRLRIYIMNSKFLIHNSQLTELLSHQELHDSAS